MNIKFSFILILTVICFSCKLKEDLAVEDFIFVNFNLRENRSIKYNGGDTVFLQIRFPELPVGNYYSILSDEEQNDFISRINNFNRKQYKSESTIYMKGEDGRSYVFVTRKKGQNKILMLNGNSQLELTLLANYFYKFSLKKRFIKTEQNLNFWNLEGIVPPPPPPIKTEIKYKSNDK